MSQWSAEVTSQPTAPDSPPEYAPKWTPEPPQPTDSPFRRNSELSSLDNQVLSLAQDKTSLGDSSDDLDFDLEVTTIDIIDRFSVPRSPSRDSIVTIIVAGDQRFPAVCVNAPIHSSSSSDAYTTPSDNTSGCEEGAMKDEIREPLTAHLVHEDREEDCPDVPTVILTPPTPGYDLEDLEDPYKELQEIREDYPTHPPLVTSKSRMIPGAGVLETALQAWDQYGPASVCEGHDVFKPEVEVMLVDPPPYRELIAPDKHKKVLSQYQVRAMIYSLCQVIWLGGNCAKYWKHTSGVYTWWPCECPYRFDGTRRPGWPSLEIYHDLRFSVFKWSHSKSVDDHADTRRF